MVWGFDTVEFVTKKIQTVWKIDIFTVLTSTAFYIHVVQMQKKKFFIIILRTCVTHLISLWGKKLLKF